MIDYFALDNPFIHVKTRFSLKARRKMYKRFLAEMKPTVHSDILDLGVTPDISLEDSNYFEKVYPYKDRITIASIEDCKFLVEEYGLKGFVFNEPRKKLPFEDNTFDILFSSAVLEHVGTREDQEFFLSECARVSKKCFITTPYRYFPLEMHTFIPFLHWLPWNVFQRFVKYTKGEFWADINNLNLLSKKDIKKFEINKSIKVDFVRTLFLKSNIIIIIDK